MEKNKDEKLRLIMLAAFVIYLILLFYFLFFADSMGRAVPGASYRYNLTIFQEIGRFLRYTDIIGARITLLNLGGNIVGFMPFGFLMPFLNERNKSICKMIVLSFTLSLFIETLQLIFRVGCFDVDDMILNTMGGTLGYFVFYVGGVLRRRRNGKQAAKEKKL